MAGKKNDKEEDRGTGNKKEEEGRGTAPRGSSERERDHGSNTHVRGASAARDPGGGDML
jgi:hypothetical protein